MGSKKKTLSVLGGSTLVIAGIVLALYVAGWLMFIGGIASAINVVRMEEPVTAAIVLKHVALIVGAAPIGAIIFWTLVIPGAAFLRRGLKK